MRIILYILIGILGLTNVYAEPYDKVIDSLSKCNTMTEFYEMKAKFYSRSNPAKLERELDFGFKHIFHEFNYDYSTPTGSYYQGFRFYAIAKDDSIIFGRLEQIHWRGSIEKRVDFKRLDIKLTKFTDSYNALYKTSITNEKLIRELTKIRCFSFCCGDACATIPKEAKRIIRYVNLNRRKKINSWLVNPNPEIQAYAIWAIKRLEKREKKQTKFEKRIINHLLENNTLIYNCSGCFMGLQTPLKELLKYELE